MKHTDFTMEQLKLLRENLAYYKANEAKGLNVNAIDSTWWGRKLPPCSIKSKPDSCDLWHCIALNAQGQVYGYAEDDYGNAQFEWLPLEELEPLNDGGQWRLEQDDPENATFDSITNWDYMLAVEQDLREFEREFERQHLGKEGACKRIAA